MKIAILSDIHSNPDAANKAYIDAKRYGCTQFICLGDVVGYGSNPAGAISWVKDRMDLCLLGNHDAGIIGKLPLDWFSHTAKNALLKNRTLISETDREYLNQLRYNCTKEIKNTTVMFAHGSALSYDPFCYIADRMSAAFEFSDMRSCGINIEFVAHTHHACSWSVRKTMNTTGANNVIFHALDKARPLRIDSDNLYIINVGSVGYPRSQHDSIYCIFDTDEMTILHRVLPFDFQQYIDDLVKVGIDVPMWLDMIDIEQEQTKQQQQGEIQMQKKTNKKVVAVKKPAVKTVKAKPAAKKVVKPVAVKKVAAKPVKKAVAAKNAVKGKK